MSGRIPLSTPLGYPRRRNSRTRTSPPQRSTNLTGKNRYGASLRKQVKKMEITQHARYTCTFCGKTTVKRTSVGIWECRSCKKTVAGGAWVVSYVPSPSGSTRRCISSADPTKIGPLLLLLQGRRFAVSARLPRSNGFDTAWGNK